MSQRKAYRARGNSPAVEYLPTISQQQPQKQTVHMEIGLFTLVTACPACSDISSY